MSENTKIEWCDYVLIQPWHAPMVGVSEPMARAAEGNAIADVEAQLGIFRPFLAMVSFKIPTFVVAAVDTHPAIPRHHVVPPTLGLQAGPSILTLGTFAIDVTRCRRPPKRTLPHDCADLRFRFGATWNAFHWASKTLRSTHACTSLCRELLAAHRRLSPLCNDSIFSFHAATPEAFGREAIVSRTVTIKKRTILPLLARRASLFLLAFRDERGQIHAGLLGGNFQSPFRSLSHG